jgi:hypothetical protein
LGRGRWIWGKNGQFKEKWDEVGIEGKGGEDAKNRNENTRGQLLKSS